MSSGRVVEITSSVPSGAEKAMSCMRPLRSSVSRSAWASAVSKCVSHSTGSSER